MRAVCLLSLQPPPQQSFWTCRDLLWPSLSIQKAAREHLVARCAPHTQQSWAQFINPLLPALTASSLLTNASLDCCSLTQFQGREATGHFLKWHKIDEVSSSPNSRRWQLGLMPKSSFSLPSKTRLMKSSYITTGSKKSPILSNMSCIAISRSHRPNTITEIQALYFLARVYIFCLISLYIGVLKRSLVMKNAWI
jgi:hypothetical protein